MQTGDTYLRLTTSDGVPLAYADDNCANQGSEFTYTVTSCDTYQVREGCYSTSTCSGVVTIYSASSSPTVQPSIAATVPSQVPTLAPSPGAPSYIPTLPGQVFTFCPPYSAINTASATVNYAICTFSACEGNYVISLCEEHGGSHTGTCVRRRLFVRVCKEALICLLCFRFLQVIPIFAW